MGVRQLCAASWDLGFPTLQMGADGVRCYRSLCPLQIQSLSSLHLKLTTLFPRASKMKSRKLGGLRSQISLSSSFQATSPQLKCGCNIFPPNLQGGGTLLAYFSPQQHQARRYCLVQLQCSLLSSQVLSLVLFIPLPSLTLVSLDYCTNDCPNDQNFITLSPSQFLF